MSAKTSKLWKKYSPQMKRMARRRERLSAVIVEAVKRGVAPGLIELELAQEDWIAVPAPALAGERRPTRFRLTYKGLCRLAAHMGVEVPS